MIHIYGKIVEFYTYRSALVRHSFNVEVDELSWKKLERFITRNGYLMDNHICWKTDGGLYYMYSDHKLFIGTDINVTNW